MFKPSWRNVERTLRLQQSRLNSTVAAAAAAEPELVAFDKIKGPGYWFLFDQVRDPYEAVAKLYKNYKLDKVAKVKGPKGDDQVYLFDHEDIRHVFLNEGQFPAGIGGEVEIVRKWAEERFKGASVAGDFIRADEAWRKARDAFGAGLMSQTATRYLPSINEASKTAVDFFPHYVENNTVDIWSQRAAFDMFYAVLFSEFPRTSDPNCKDPVKEMVALDSEALGMAVQLSFTPKILQPWGGYERMCNAFDRICELSKPVIDDLFDKKSEKSSWFKDLKDERGVSKEVLAASIPTFLSAGIGTTMSVIQWNVLQLANNPDKQEVLYQELKQNLPDGMYSKEAKLPYLEAFIRECHRLTPTSPVLTARRLKHDITLPSGFQIPAGVLIHLSPISKAQDSEFVENSDVFLPERFLKENAEARKGCPHASSVDSRLNRDPFSMGKRVCLGKRAAELEVRSVLCELVLRYQVEATPRNQPFKFAVSTTGFPNPFPKVKCTPRQ